MHLESRNLAPGTVNLRLGAVRRRNSAMFGLNNGSAHENAACTRAECEEDEEGLVECTLGVATPHIERSKRLEYRVCYQSAVSWWARTDHTSYHFKVERMDGPVDAGTRQ